MHLHSTFKNIKQQRFNLNHWDLLGTNVLCSGLLWNLRYFCALSSKAECLWPIKQCEEMLIHRKTLDGSKQEWMSKHNTLILVGMFSQKRLSAEDYFLFRTSKELAMKSRSGKARRISAASFPGFVFFLTTFSLLVSTIGELLLPAPSPETQVSLVCATCGRNERTIEMTKKLSHSINLKWIHEQNHTPLVL